MTPRLQASYPGGSQIGDQPPVFLFEDYLTGPECTHLIELAQPHMQPAVVSGGSKGVASDGRTGGVYWIAHDRTPLTLGIATRIAELVGLPLDNAEALQVINYGPGQEYKPHYDAWVAGTETGDRCLSRGGQRLVTCLIYLNTVAEGGGTFFPRLDIEVMPRPGRLLLFHNCLPEATERHPASLHGGLAPASGFKWACNLWFRAQRFRDRGQPVLPSASTRRY